MKIEVGDKVIFRTDLQGNKEYGTETFVHNMNKFCNKPQIVNRVSPFGETFSIVGDDCEWSFTPEMVSEVIKPTKESQQTEFEITLLEGSLFWVEWLEASKSNALNEETTSAAIRDMYKKINEIIEHLKNKQ